MIKVTGLCTMYITECKYSLYMLNAKCKALQICCHWNQRKWFCCIQILTSLLLYVRNIFIEAFTSENMCFGSGSELTENVFKHSGHLR